MPALHRLRTLLRTAALATCMAVLAAPPAATGDTGPTGRATVATVAALDGEPSTARGAPAVMPPRAAATRAAATTATIRGSVFYNDRRTDGLFAERRDKAGAPGQRCSPDGKRDDGSACSLNWLAGKYMVVDAIERDLPASNKTGTGCVSEQVIGSATVAYDGSFSVTVPINDACSNDLLAPSAIELRVRLRFCGSSYCFSINRADGSPYTLSHPNASASNPRTVRAGDDITMAAMNYSTAADPAQPNNDSIAANYYASIVDTVLALHKDNPIPFYKDEFGEIEYVFPSTASSTATTKSAGQVVISTFQSQPGGAGTSFKWVDGKTPAHEYGHVMMLRAWDGSYGFDGVGISAGSDEPAVSQQIAFKEGWAEFIPRVVFPLTRGCSRAGYDDNGGPRNCSAIADALAQLQAQRAQQVQIIPFLQGAGLQAAQAQLAAIDAQIADKQAELALCQTPNTFANLPGPLGQGAQWRDNVTKALCDWFDDRDEDDARLAGAGDHFTAEDIYSMWFNLRRMKLDAAQYGGQFASPGLWFCDYVRYYLDVRKSAAEVGTTSHASYEDKIRDLIYNNNIGCSMSAPQ